MGICNWPVRPVHFVVKKILTPFLFARDVEMRLRGVTISRRRGKLNVISEFITKSTYNQLHLSLFVRTSRT